RIAARVLAQWPESRLLGCYQLATDPGNKTPFQYPPFFQLEGTRPVGDLPMMRRMDDASRVRTPSNPPFDTAAAFGSWRHALPDPWFHTSGSLWSTAWRVTDRDTLELRWSDGYSPMNLKLHLDGDTLRGTIHVGSDQVGHDRTDLARAWRIRCP